ncbi:MAG: AMP nucleosidase [bacterium]|nr:AMP nucleosidase [bacterium]
MTLQETMIPQTSTLQNECITIIARSPGQALKEFHRRGLGKQGYAISGRVVPHKFEVIDDEGSSEELFNGEHFYSATFFRKEEQRR